MTAKHFDTVHSHNYPWAQVASAYWRRYPNPNSKHVFSEDFVECELIGDGKLLYTKRYIAKTNSLPVWGEHFFRARYVPLTEEAVIDPRAKTLTTYTRNIGALRFWMGVTEKVVFKPDPECPETRTLVEKQAWIESDMFGFRSAIKKFGIDRFKKNSLRASQGFDWVLDRLYSSSSAASGKMTKTNTNNVYYPGAGVPSKIQLAFPSGDSDN